MAARLSLAYTAVALGAALIVAAPSASASQWRLVWSDEFDTDRLDGSKWTPDVDCWGGGNEERQCYTPNAANHRVANGLLDIIARQETHKGPAFPPDQRTTPDLSLIHI